MEFRLRPARDLGLAPGERLRSHAREAGLGSLALRSLWRGGVGAYLRLAHRLEVMGQQNLPAGPPFILIANHCSHLDTLALGSILQGEAGRRAHALAAGDVFFRTGATARARNADGYGFGTARTFAAGPEPSELPG